MEIPMSRMDQEKFAWILISGAKGCTNDEIHQAAIKMITNEINLTMHIG